eukprot:TRINITY_DN7820_c0_g1_i2.p1 TRINITY_DN7820_c0_g1~~TRINITY_DN7820_c0_g1_i2.p1  ORF type:complete len:482 (+),score=78.66 TRINITY_DN7820_c0_g1_i2:111-1556(+)
MIWGVVFYIVLARLTGSERLYNRPWTQRCDIELLNEQPSLHDRIEVPRLWRVKDDDFAAMKVDDLSIYAHQHVMVGHGHSIVESGGEGSFKTTLEVYLNYLETGHLPSWQQAKPKCPRVERDTTGLYVFDRGGFMRANPALQTRAHVPHLWPRSAWQRQRNHLKINNLVLGTEAQLGAINTYLLLGGNGSGVPFHAHTDSIARVHQGQKLWLFYPPDSLPPASVHKYASIAQWLETHDYTADLNLRMCLTRPGDVLYIPANWHHATINYGTILAFASQPHLALQQPLGYLVAAAQLIAQGRLNDAKEVVNALEELSLSSAEQHQLAEVKFSLYLEVVRKTQDKALSTLLHHRYNELQRPSCSLMAQACDVSNLNYDADWAAKVCAQVYRRCPYHGKGLFHAGLHFVEQQKLDQAEQAFSRLRTLPESHLHAMARMQLTNLALMDPSKFLQRYNEAKCYHPDAPALQRQAELYRTYYGKDEL